MSDPKHDEPSTPKSGENQATGKASPQVTPSTVPASEVDPSKPVEELTPEDQMALYEKQLKEDDWGHQPC